MKINKIIFFLVLLCADNVYASLVALKTVEIAQFINQQVGIPNGKRALNCVELMQFVVQQSLPQPPVPVSPSPKVSPINPPLLPSKPLPAVTPIVLPSPVVQPQVPVFDLEQPEFSIRGARIFDLKVLSQNCAISECGAKHCPLYGCEFMALKNVLLTVLGLQNPAQMKNYFDLMQDAQSFANYFASDNGWYDARAAYRRMHPRQGGYHNVISQPEELVYLIKQIAEKKLIAPAGSDAIAKDIAIVYDLDNAPNHERKKEITLESAVHLYQAGQIYCDQKNVILPFILGYSHRYGAGEFGYRHWICVVVEKTSIEANVFYADAWRRYDTYNKAAIDLLLQWLKNPQKMLHEYSQKLSLDKQIELSGLLYGSSSISESTPAAIPAQSGSWKKFDMVLDKPVLPLERPVAAEYQKVAGLVSHQQTEQDIPVYQLRALTQQQYFDCGFHSLKNVFYVLQSLKTNPMTSVVATKLKNDLLQTYNQRWIDLAKLIPTYKSNDGIFPDDQRILLHEIATRRNDLIPPGCSKDIISDIWPCNGLNDNFMSSDDRHMVPELLYRLFQNQITSVAFTLPPRSGVEHFIGVIFHRVNTQSGLEIFVVDSLNSDLPTQMPVIRELIGWYDDIARAVTTPKRIDYRVLGHVERDLSPEVNQLLLQNGQKYLLNEGFVGTLQKLFLAIQQVVVDQKITGTLLSKTAPVMIYLEKLLCFYYKQAHESLYLIDDDFKFHNIGGKIVDAHHATGGILPKKYNEFKPMLEYWAQTLGVSLTQCKL